MARRLSAESIRETRRLRRVRPSYGDSVAAALSVEFEIKQAAADGDDQAGAVLYATCCYSMERCSDV